MSSKKVRDYLRSHVLGLVAIFVAFSGTAIAAGDSGSGGGDPKASASVVTDAKFKKLKKRVAALEGRPDQVGPTPVIPTSLPPSGPAGGVLDGTYPNPGLADNSVGSTEIIDGNVGSAEIGAAAVDSSEVATLTERSGTPSAAITGGTGENGNYDSISASVECALGEQIISAWGVWSGDQITGNPDEELAISEINVDSTASFLDPMDATIVGINDSGASRTLTAVALCL